jgi:Putative transposon-encoded protein (DUF2080)
MRRMKTKQIESTVTKSGNSGHIIVPKDWIGKGVIIKFALITKSQLIMEFHNTYVNNKQRNESVDSWMIVLHLALILLFFTSLCIL